MGDETRRVEQAHEMGEISGTLRAIEKKLDEGFVRLERSMGNHEKEDRENFDELWTRTDTIVENQATQRGAFRVVTYIWLFLQAVLVSTFVWALNGN